MKILEHFYSRHSNPLSAKRAICFDSNHDDWCTVHNFEQMYNKVYASMVDGGVAIKWVDSENWINHDGKYFELEEDAYGRNMAYLLICLEVLFVDEVGCNMSPKNDANISGEKFLVDPESQAQITLVSKDCHFTVLGFTDADGRPVLCTIILACRVLKIEYIMGVNPFAEVDEATLSDENCDGEDKWFCEARGEKVPCFVGHS